MKQVSNAYKQAMNKNIRNHSYMVVTVGIISAEAQTTATITSNTHHASDNISLFKDGVVQNTYASLETNVFKADGSLVFMPEDTEYPQLLDNVCALSRDVQGSITVTFDKPYNIKGLTIDFGEYYPTEFSISKNGGASTTYHNNSAIHTNDVNYNGTNSITITPISFVNGNNKRLRINSMKMGLGIVFQNEDIESATYSDSSSFISEELPQLNFNITCFDKYKKFNVDDANSFINYLETGQEIETSLGMELDNGSIEWVKMPLTYLSTWSSDTNKIAFSSVDRFALLTGKYTSGNTIHERTLYDDAVSVLADAGLAIDEYEITDVLRDKTIVNPLPEVSHAECLQLIANAGRCLLKQDENGKICLKANFENILEPDELEISTTSQARWSIPDNVRHGASRLYADLSRDFLRADGSFSFMPENNSELALLDDSGYVSSMISDENGEFTNYDAIYDSHGNIVSESGTGIPEIALILPALYTYYGVKLTFATPVKKLGIIAFDDDDNIKARLEVTSDTSDGQLEFNISVALDAFNEIAFFVRETPKAHQRVVLQQISFGNLTEYSLKKKAMLGNPIGTVEPKVQTVSVKVFTFQNGAQGEQPQALDDNVYSTFNVNPTGENVTFENQLISTQAHALEVAKWIANYYANNVTYEVAYRGEPRIESADYIFLESDIINNLQTEVEGHNINFNGALSGTLNLRRATNLVGD